MKFDKSQILLNRKMPQTANIHSKPLIPMMSAATGEGQSSLIAYLLGRKLESEDNGNIQTISPEVCR